MCAGAIIQARISLLVYGLGEPLTGAAGSIVDLLHLPSLNHRVDVISGVLADEVKSVMDAFFRQLREHPGTTERGCLAAEGAALEMR